MDSQTWLASDRGHLDEVARSVVTWIDSALDSPLYAYLAPRIAQDPQMLVLVAAIANTPPLNLLFGGVKLRLTAEDPLAAWTRTSKRARPTRQSQSARSRPNCAARKCAIASQLRTLGKRRS
jgi:hypothetical protein